MMRLSSVWKRARTLVFTHIPTAMLTLSLLVGSDSLARTAEVIQSYESDIQIEKTGDLTVVEKIIIATDGSTIKHGIFRDMPLTFIGEDGITHHVDFKITKIERDGALEDYHTESINNGVRIYIGNKDTYIQPGQHAFKISYTTGRQIRYFQNHDELYWNVTGNFWHFPIVRASAVVTLPAGAKAEATTFFTGPLGSTAKNATVSENGREIFFTTTRPLALEEGLTIGVKLQKGVIAPPSETDRQWWWFSDNRNLIIAAIGLVLISIYFFTQWLRVGRDPQKGVIVPRWDVPGDLSPALVYYLAHKGRMLGNWTAFSASLVNLAVKGLVKIDQQATTMSMAATGKAPSGKLTAGEEMILTKLGSRNSPLVVNKANGKTIKALGDSFSVALEKEHKSKYYLHNSGTAFLGLVLTILSVLAPIFLGRFSEDLLVMFIAPTIVFVVVGIFSGVLFSTLANSFNPALRIIAILIIVAFWSGFFIVLYVSGSAAFAMLNNPADKIALILTGATIVIALLFLNIMDASTPLGRQMLDGIDGLALYINVAEKQRMNMPGAPEMSRQHFEKLLPYAIALGIERPWSTYFEHWLATASLTDQEYHPTWYSGDRFDNRHFSDSISNMSNSMSSQIQSSLPAPPSSSSSGFSSSGSSGGGGGGGGGGGW